MWAIPVFGGLLLLLIVILLIPIEARIDIDTDSGKPFRLRTTWFFGIVKYDLKNPDEQKKKSVTKQGRADFTVTDALSSIDGIGSMSARFVRLIRSIYRQLKIGEVKGYLEIGTEDPVSTGMMFAVIGPVNAMLNALPNYDVTVVPAFEDEGIFEGTLYGNARIRPVDMIVPLLRFGFSRDILRFGKKAIRSKIRRGR